MKDGLGFSKQVSKYINFYSPHRCRLLIELAGDEYAVVRPTKTVYDKTVASWDNRPPTPFNEVHWKDTIAGEAYRHAVEFLDKAYGHLFEDPIMSPEEIAETVDWTKSPGWPYTHFGFKTKLEVVKQFKLSEDRKKIDRKVYLHCAFKIEFLPTTEIRSGKGRVFQIPPIDLLYSQLKFGKKISLRIKNFHWSKYGFNPYSGGFNKLAQDLLKKVWRGCYDVSGWDKFLCVLRDLYALLKNRAGLNEEQVEEFLWMANNTYCFLLKIMNGTVLFKDYGNASGSGTTTRDNILAHILVFASGLYLAYYHKNGYFPSFATVFEQVVALFGDDNVFSLDEDFSLMCTEEFLREHLAQFGLKLKFFFGGKNYPLEKLSFLGAHFVQKNGMWYPHYDPRRLATSMIYELGGSKTLNVEKTLGKIFVLTVMSYPTEHWNLFREAYSDFLNHPTVRAMSSNSTVGTYIGLGVPDDPLMESFYQGLESGCPCDSVSFLKNHFTTHC